MKTEKQTQFFARYDAGENTYTICTDLKIPFYVAFMWIKKSGRAVRENAVGTLSNTQKVGYFGEQLFKKYAPKACNVNNVIKMNNPIYDFEYEYLKIDVKTARPKWKNKNSNTATWQFDSTGNRLEDLIYVFFMLPDDKENEIPLDEIDDKDIGCLVMPSLLLPDTLKSFTFHETRGFDKYGDFMIELSDLQKNLDLIVQAV